MWQDNLSAALPQLVKTQTNLLEVFYGIKGGCEMTEFEKIVSYGITARSGLKDFLQKINVVIKKATPEYPEKLGLELRSMPIKEGEEVKAKPRSFFVSKEELCKLDSLIFTLVKWRFYFARRTGLIEGVYDLRLGKFLNDVRKNILDGLGSTEKTIK